MKYRLRKQEVENKEKLQSMFELASKSPQTYELIKSKNQYQIKYELYHKDKSGSFLLSSVSLDLVNGFKWRWIGG